VRTRKAAGESVSISGAFSSAESAGSLVDGVYKLAGTIPAEEAFLPLSEGGCPLVRA